jgi:hypothetical protein
MKFAAAQFGANNEVLVNDLGQGSFYVKVPKFGSADVLPSGATARTHPAFIVGGAEKDYIYVGKYHAVVKNSRALSLPGAVPTAYTAFDTAVTLCKANGAGFHALTNAEYSALSLWSKKNGTMPRGNTNYGKSDLAATEIGIAATKETSGAFRTLSTRTGSQYAAWYHD